MSRGNQREKDRARAAARSAKKAKQAGSTGDVQAKNRSDAAALAAKIAAKKAAKEAGTYKSKDERDKGSKYQGKGSKGEKNMINPHTGKRDAKYTAKMKKKNNDLFF